MDFTRSGLEEHGFVGFVPIRTLRAQGCDSAPARQGVYVVFLESPGQPAFLSESTGGTHKGKDPTVDVSRLESEWVYDAQVLYVGKTDGPLRERIAEYIKCGRGLPHGHWGGRLIWQLADSDDLLVAWKPLDLEDPEATEQALLQDFVSRHGRLPFANLRN